MSIGYWKIEITGVDELTDTDREHIASLIKEGFSEGEIIQDETEICTECGAEFKTFMHNCPNTSTMEEVTGCPVCDDNCGFCKIIRIIGKYE